MEAAMSTAFTKYFDQLSSNIINERVAAGDSSRDIDTRYDIQQQRPSAAGWVIDQS